MPPLASIVAAAHEFIQHTPSLIAIAQIDDLVGEFTGVNLPGTDRERPNWRRKLAGPLAVLPAALPLFNLVILKSRDKLTFLLTVS